MEPNKFDEYARNYDALRSQNVHASGESLDYFADYKLACLKRLGFSAHDRALDYGCGIGGVTRKLVDYFAEVHGYDPSSESLRLARDRAPLARFHDDLSSIPRTHFDVAVLSGVLHHVDHKSHPQVLTDIRSYLRPGGRIVVFEHNPLNPLTRRAVATCPFDDDAKLLWPWQAAKLLKAAGYQNVRLDFIVFFPRALRWLRRFEPGLRALPLGAQMMVLGMR